VAKALAAAVLVSIAWLAAGWAPYLSVGTAASPSGDYAYSLPSGDVLHYMAPSGSGGSDSNDGLAATVGGGHGPWLTPNHALHCGDVIVAVTGTYSASGMGTFGAVSNCPSTTGGIDGTGGVWFAVIVCAGKLTTCDMTGTTNIAVNITSHNWAVEGFQVHNATGTAAFLNNGKPTATHHVAFINDIAYSTPIGFGSGDDGTSHDVPGVSGFDYAAFVGTLAQNSEQNTVCTAATTMTGPNMLDTAAGTHIFIYGSFSYDIPDNGCRVGDMEDFMFDTFDAHGVTTTGVILNNLGWGAASVGVNSFTQNFNSVAGLHVYIENNTTYHDMEVISGYLGELRIQNNNTAPEFEYIYNNVFLATASATNSCGISAGASAGSNIIVGATGKENVAWSTANSGWGICYYSVATGVNFVTNPNFTNTADLLANWVGVAPNCSGYATTTACMGYDATTSTLRTLTPISDLTPTCTNCAGKGYQLPSVTCVTSGDIYNLYPTWLKGIVYLQWNSVSQTLTEKAGLVTKPCGL